MSGWKVGVLPTGHMREALSSEQSLVRCWGYFLPTQSLHLSIHNPNLFSPDSTGFTKSALIDPFSFVVVSSRRDVPPERLYKVRRVAEKGGIKPGFASFSEKRFSLGSLVALLRTHNELEPARSCRYVVLFFQVFPFQNVFFLIHSSHVFDSRLLDIFRRNRLIQTVDNRSQQRQLIFS